jgi:DNA-binding NarL/FixJ family response regulator
VNVLVLDDAIAIRSRLAAMFEELPGVRKVVQAANLAEASDALRTQAPAVVIIDLRLRGESGIAFIPRVQRERPGALVIVLTNEPSERHRSECLALGVNHFFDKSRHFDEVLGLVAAATAPTRSVSTSDA